MKRSVLMMAAVVALAGVAMVPGESRAHGLRRHSCGEVRTCGASPCAAPCAAVVAVPAPVEYREVKVTKYKQEMVTKDVTELVCKTITKEVPYKYTVSIPVVTPTRQVVQVCKSVTKEVPCEYTVMVPRTVQEKVMCTTYQCVTEVVEKMVPVCRTVRVPCVDACGRCTYVCERVTGMHKTCCTVVKRVPVTKEMVVNRIVCDAVKKQGTRLVCELVRENQEITVNVCSYKTEERVGKKLVCEVVTEKVSRKVQFCQVTPYTETVRVPVAAPCATTSCCEPACGHARRGLFRRGSCGGCN